MGNKLDNTSFTYDFVIIDTNENILYSKGYKTFNSIESTLKKHDTYIGIIEDNKQIGTAIIFTNLEVNNIINNSYKYANTKIDVDFNLDFSYLQINIKDYGQGVSEDELPLLFNKFYRGKNPDVPKQDGSGLGLYISKYLMNEMDSDINCFNETDGFKVELLIHTYTPLPSCGAKMKRNL